MTPVTQVEGRAIPLGIANIDTDVIIAAEHLKTVTRSGLGAHALESLRRAADNVIDDPAYTGANILIAGANFGCGSSREHAVWALMDRGITAVIAPSFSDIFSGNAFKNGMVTVVLPQPQIDRLMAVAETQPMTIDLTTMTVTTPFQDRFSFGLDEFRRDCLLHGTDEIALTMASDAAIGTYESSGAPMLHVPRG
ncbi:3-isopropylmalate dehydratase small subunit [Sphingomonas sp. 28-63-12]|uniref:3-isopropylmalate dehydratase small subunit n=1 Tax=Sphingomonas sp. 28-63-12 TaxID=1970434 RepID=UPI000BC60072|nr:MAG: 3-isopropylmalate dehydratase small subunit [Sphingomonas sp. 28-63-12]